jgi:hypothetical protein
MVAIAAFLYALTASMLLLAVTVPHHWIIFLMPFCVAWTYGWLEFVRSEE